MQRLEGGGHIKVPPLEQKHVQVVLSSMYKENNVVTQKHSKSILYKKKSFLLYNRSIRVLLSFLILLKENNNLYALFLQTLYPSAFCLGIKSCKHERA